jgi:hypothetical protein
VEQEQKWLKISILKLLEIEIYQQASQSSDQNVISSMQQLNLRN